MKIKIDLKIFIFLIVFILTKQIKIYSFLMLFAFIHELGHLFAGIVLKFKPESFKIAPYGFSIRFNTYESNNKLSIKKLIIAIAGPVTNLILAIIFYTYYIITKQNVLMNIPIELLIYSNILIMIFNLIPIYPLDGGRIIKEITYLSKNSERSYMLTNKISNVTIILLTIASSFLILFYKNFAIIIILAYLWIINIKRNNFFELKMKLNEFD